MSPYLHYTVNVQPAELHGKIRSLEEAPFILYGDQKIPTVLGFSDIIFGASSHES